MCIDRNAIIFRISKEAVTGRKTYQVIQIVFSDVRTLSYFDSSKSYFQF